MSIVSAASYSLTPTPDSLDHKGEVRRDIQQPASISNSAAQQSPEELRGLIKKFLKDQLGKWGGKATHIIKRIPNNNDAVKLNNIYQALLAIRSDNYQFYRLQRETSWPRSMFDCIFDNPVSHTTGDQRLTLRALQLYCFAELDPKLRKDDWSRYNTQISSALNTAFDIKYGRNNTIRQNLNEAEEEIKKAKDKEMREASNPELTEHNDADSYTDVENIVLSVKSAEKLFGHELRTLSVVISELDKMHGLA